MRGKDHGSSPQMKTANTKTSVSCERINIGSSLSIEAWFGWKRSRVSASS